MNVKIGRTLAALVLVLSLCACAANNGNNQGADRDDGVAPFGVSDNDRDRGLGDGRINRWDNERNTNAASMHNNTRMDIDEKIAEAVADMEGIDRAYVMMTDKNAYVAVNMDRNGNGRMNARGNDDDVDEAVKARIASKVKQLAPDVRNVYVSANPDFVDRMRGYGERFQDGQPIRGMILEFNRAVERLFPDRVEFNGNNRR